MGQLEGIGLELSEGILTGLAVALAISWGFQLKHINVISSRGLGFLIKWWLGSAGEKREVERENTPCRSCTTFCDLDSEARQCLSYSWKLSSSPVQAEGKVNRPHLLIGGWQGSGGAGGAVVGKDSHGSLRITPLIFFSIVALTFDFEITLGLQTSCKNSTEFPHTFQPVSPPITAYKTVEQL